MDNLSPVKVSICCATYNHKPYIRQCLEGFLMQKTSFPYEILIHDDASTDGTTDIIREYANTYPELVLPVIQTENQYSSKTRAVITNFLLPISKGEYIALCEGDDYWTDPLKLQKQIEIMDNNKDYSLCFHDGLKLRKENIRSCKRYRTYANSQVVPYADIIRRKGLFCPTASIVYRKELMKNYPSFCLTCHVGDFPLILYIGLMGKVFYHKDSMSVYRIQTPESWTIRFNSSPEETQYDQLQTELNMLDEFNKLSGYIYDLKFKEKKAHLEIGLFLRLKRFDKVNNPKLLDEVNALPFKMRIPLWIKIYILPYIKCKLLKKRNR